MMLKGVEITKAFNYLVLREYQLVPIIRTVIEKQLPNAIIIGDVIKESLG
jgi:hypothetical protein